MRTLWEDRRGVTVQVGAILLFGILILGLATYQTIAVPVQNEGVEFNHNQRVQSDMLDLWSAVLGAGTGERLQSTPIELGTTYPSRVLLINPPPPSGRLSTGPERIAAFQNIRATESETADYLDTDANGAYNLTTRNLVYRPGYNVYDGAPTTTVQSGVAVNEFPGGGDTAISGQTLVRGNDLFLVALTGDLSRAQSGTVTVDPRTLSASISATTVRNTTAGNVTLVVPTTLSAERWEDLLGDEYDPGFDSTRSHVYDVSAVPDRDAVALSLDSGVTYRLRTALVGVGQGGTVPEPAYLTVVDGEGDVTVEVRDRYNNPVANSRVPDNLTVNVTEGRGVLRQVRLPVGEDGRASFDATGSGEVNLTLENQSGSLLDADNGSVETRETGTMAPPAMGTQASQVEFVSMKTGSNNSEVELTVRNAGSSPVTVSGFTLNSVAGPASEIDGLSGPEVQGGGGEVSVPGAIGEGEKRIFDPDATIAPSSEVTFTIRYFRKQTGSGFKSQSVTGKNVSVNLIFNDTSEDTYDQKVSRS